MISKEQFVLLIDALKEQLKYEEKFNDGIAFLNTSHTVVELAPALTDAIFDVLALDFTDTGFTIAWEYVFNDKKIAEWDERESGEFQSYSYKITNPGKLYDILKKHFSYDVD